MKFNERGEELPDQTPIELPVGVRRPESLNDMMRRMIRTSLSQYAADQGEETFEEANDFDIPDDDPTVSNTQYQEMSDEVTLTQEDPRQARGAPAREHRSDSRSVRDEESRGERQGARSRRPPRDEENDESEGPGHRYDDDPPRRARYDEDRDYERPRRSTGSQEGRRRRDPEPRGQRSGRDSALNRRQPQSDADGDDFD